MFGNTWHGTWRGRSPDGLVHKRARQVISSSGGIVRGKFPSRKNGRMVHYEGLLELDAIYLFETSPRIASYREQPETIYYPDGARLRRYTPDFELILTTGEPILIEAKPSRSLEDEDVRHKLDCVSTYFRRSAQPFIILDDGTLRCEPRQANLRAIYHQAPRLRPPVPACRAALSHYADQFPLTIAASIQLLSERGIDPFSLLLAGLLRCDLDQRVSPRTLLALTKGDDDAWFCIAHGHGF